MILIVGACCLFVGFIAGAVALMHSMLKAEAIIEAWRRARWRNISVSGDLGWIEIGTARYGSKVYVRPRQ